RARHVKASPAASRPKTAVDPDPLDEQPVIPGRPAVLTMGCAGGGEETSWTGGPASGWPGSATGGPASGCGSGGGPASGGGAGGLARFGATSAMLVPITIPS